MAFRVGQKVVCVDDIFHDPKWVYIRNFPVRGQIYTIRESFIEKFGDGDLPAVLLEEVINPPLDIWKDYDAPHEFGWSACRFRPLVEKSTDTGMAVLREICDRETDQPPVKAKPRKNVVT